MSTFLCPLGPKPIFHPYPSRTRTLQRPLFHRTNFPRQNGLLVVPKFGFLNSGQLPDPEIFEGTLKELFGRAEGILYTIADAAVSTSDVVDASTTATKQNNGDWLSGITATMETVLKVLKDGLSTVHAPYAYGFAIILLTVLVKAATFPLSKKQVESAMAMRSLQPQIKAIQKRYAGDQERMQLETARLYKLAGINPLAGCLPTLATIPVWIGLYRALSNVANEGLLTEGFFWIPSLAGPTTIASRQNGSGISWLFPFIDGHPPLGWSDTAAYLVLPVLLVVSQYISVQIMQSSQPNDPNLKGSQALTKLLPLMIGYFALSVPSGLSLYWFTNNILSTLQQVYLQKGGANNPLGKLSDDFFKEEETPLPKSVVETKSSIETKSIVETKSVETEEKLPSPGLRPGERFKQLKEEEAKRKRQMEEEKMKSEVAAANKNAVQLVESGTDQHATASVDASTDGTATNGRIDGCSKEHQDATEVTSENGRPINGTADGTAGEDSEDINQEVVEVHTRLPSVDRSSEAETS
ncbi:ALBINO3-like protein 1, chloroplastic [Beta vulgaris subsp. vulgaris]|uniref:ALBINO3-like protein 1, chloroplastic n=1 Tax=Beta vulgaris subsp. vulgaris TaxID=3555 RepID=UPI0020368EF8|nr:ALBINO3-like protein 1, chloroplastic [Beta vulgaris subsp. vulgaris]